MSNYKFGFDNSQKTNMWKIRLIIEYLNLNGELRNSDPLIEEFINTEAIYYLETKISLMDQIGRKIKLAYEKLIGKSNNFVNYLTKLSYYNDMKEHLILINPKIEEELDELFTNFVNKQLSM